MPHVPAHSPAHDLAAIAYGSLQAVQADAPPAAVAAADAQLAQPLPPYQDPQFQISNFKSQIPPPPDSCLLTPVSSDPHSSFRVPDSIPSDFLSTRAGYERINFFAARAELIMMHWANGIALPDTPEARAAFDPAVLDRLTLHTWRLTAVRTSLHKLELSLEHQAGERARVEEEKKPALAFIDRRALEAFTPEKLIAHGLPELAHLGYRPPQPAPPEQPVTSPQPAPPAPLEETAPGAGARPHQPAPAAGHPAPEAQPSAFDPSDPHSDYHTRCGHYRSALCPGRCSRCPHYSTDRAEDAYEPDPDYLAALDRAAAEYKRSQSEEAAPASSEGTVPPWTVPVSSELQSPSPAQSIPSMGSIGSIRSIPPVAPSPDLPLAPSSSSSSASSPHSAFHIPHSPQVPACPTLSLDRIERTLARVADDLNAGSADVSSAIAPAGQFASASPMIPAPAESLFPSPSPSPSQSDLALSSQSQSQSRSNSTSTLRSTPRTHNPWFNKPFPAPDRIDPRDPPDSS